MQGALVNVHNCTIYINAAAKAIDRGYNNIVGQTAS